MKRYIIFILALVSIANTVIGQQSEPDYLCFEVTKGTIISLKRVSNNYQPKPNIQYSYDKTSWNDLVINKEITIDNDCDVFFRGNNPNGINKNDDNYVYFYVSNSFACHGNIMSLIDGVGETTEIPTHFCFAHLFQNCPLTTAPKLPATTITAYCYDKLFCGCKNLTTPPELPATEVYLYSYGSMFLNCSRLTTAPILPATKLGDCCYLSMFSGCESLLVAPELPATTLAYACYETMFGGCKSLTTTPVLPAINLTKRCYYGMFMRCTNLQRTAPILYTNAPSDDWCCRDMFNGCSNLEYISVRFRQWFKYKIETLPGQSIYEYYPTTQYWVKNVSQKGLFVCKGIAKQYDVDHIPEGWDVIIIDDLEVYNINIPQESRNYIIIPYTTEIKAGTEMSFYIKDRTSEGYTFDGVTVVGSGQNPITLTNNNNVYTFTMPAEDVTISVTYSSTPINYTITTDDYSIADKTEASEGETVNVTFKDRAGYNLTSATYNGTALTITNNAAQFTMPAANVTIATTHTPIEYKITAGEFVTVDKTKATINDQVSFTVEDRTNNGYKLDKVLVNNTEFTGRSFNMADYLKDVTISAQYSKIAYTIATDDYSSTNKTTANVGDVIDVTFKNRDGYNLTSATYNGTALTITNNTSSFTMPAANVTIATAYTKVDYTITADQYSTPNKATANVGDEITVTFANREGYNLTSATYNGTALNISNNTASFTMPAANVTIATTYTKVDYTITADQYSTPNKTKANVGDEITVTFANRDGYNLTSATYNGTALNVSNNTATFTMPAANVIITTTYTKIDYTITADQYSTPNKTTANFGDEITVTFANRDGYNLTSATYNGTALNISNNKASFTMPAENVVIATTYTKIDYTITADQYSTPNKTKANVGDEITITFANRDGYNLTSAIYNGTALNISKNTASFTMPAANVTIATTYTKIDYTITADQYSTPNKTTANVGDEITVSFANRDGYNLTSATYNGTALTITNNKASFTMPAENVVIATTYTKIDYTITADQYSTPNKTKANDGDEITVTFANRDGYNLTSATYNGTALNVSNNTATFTMPAANVTIATTHTPIEYNITAGEFVTVDKTKATINDQVSFTVEDRTNDGYKLDKVLVNNTDFSGTSFNMADYLKDVTIMAIYSKNSNPVVEYSITNDEFSTTDKASANEGNVITVTFINRDGYNLTAATYNGTPLNITNNAAQFTMPAANVTIATTYKPIKNDKLLIVDEIIVEADGYCAGDVLRLSFKTTCKNGKYQIMFSERAKTEGFVDLDFADIEDSERQTAKFDIPSSTNYGNYQGFIRVVDADGNEGAAFPFGFNIDYPNDIIETKYADLICVNNFSHNYVAYQWMKNGKEIAGANKQFYIDYPALNGVYNVIVTDKNGNKFKVCDFRAELKTKSAPKPSVNVYPNPAQSMQPVTIELVGVDNTEKCEIMLYTHSGALVQKIADAKTMNVVYLKSGIYTGVVVINGKKLTFKLIVND